MGSGKRPQPAPWLIVNSIDN